MEKHLAAKDPGNRKGTYTVQVVRRADDVIVRHMEIEGPQPHLSALFVAGALEEEYSIYEYSIQIVRPDSTIYELR
jgi:hypothetical protein